jgi:hypothetical protein
MYFANQLPLAAVGHPLFGNQWLALLAMLGLIAIFIALVAVIGRILAATHPDNPQPAKKQVVEHDNKADLATSAPSPELMAVISAAVAATLGHKAHIVAVQTMHAPSVETLMLQWSLEGRREIYTSHRIR